ncbi:MAG: DUF2069 domain-containing protein [Pseudomonadota bacterium]|nr:MAG: DUF2069 domain-containing protein [Pseudomonadota bacterium]
MAWITWLAPPQVLPVALVLVLMVGPLLLPLRGMLRGHPYTHAWASFLSLIYFTHGTVEAYAAPDERVWALLEVILSVLFFSGAMFYARCAGRAQRPRKRDA